MDPQTADYPSTTHGVGTTNAGIDPATLHVQATQRDGIPSLGVQSVDQIKAGSNNPFVEKNASTLPSSSTGTKSTSGPGSTDKSSTGPTATGLRQRVNNLGSQLDSATHQAADHPVVQNAKGTAQKQIAQLREQLGRSQTIRDLEKKLQIDRVYLVLGGVFLYILLIPLNLFGLALPTTTLLTLLPPSFLALGILDAKGVSSEQNEAATRALLAYFVTLGFIQFLESLAAGVLEKRIPQYYTVKLLVLAYLLHPRTQGAMLLHQNVYKPLFIQGAASKNIHTPPQSKEAGFHANSPPTSSHSNNGSTLSSGTGSGLGSGGSVPSSLGTFQSDSHGNVTKQDSQGKGFSVVSEIH